MLRRLTFTFCALLLLQGAQAQSWQDTLARIESAFARFKPDGPGAQMAISRNGKVIFSKAWGLAELEHKTPMTTTSLIEAGSVSKQFTAAAILLLEQQGKLSVEDDVRKYVPELPEYAHTIRISHLLHHSSGLKDWGAVAELSGWPRGERNYTNNDALRIICRQKSLNNEPGYEYIYSNTNYTLMTIIVERVSKKTLEAYTNEFIFTPAGMEQSHWRTDLRQLVPNRAMAYGRNQQGFYLNMPNESVYGHAALLTTAEELLKWNGLYTEGRFGSPSLYPKQTATVPLTSGHPAMYAAGLMTNRFNGRPAVTHSGATAGYRANLEYYPELGMSFAYLCNSSAFDRDSTNAAAVVRNIFIPEPAPENKPQTAVPAIAVTEATLQGLAGWYRNVRSEDGMKLVVSNGSLYDGKNKLSPIGGGTFRNQDGLRYAFSPDKLSIITARQDTFAFKPAGLPDTTLAGREQFVGEYVSEDAEARWTISLDNKNLVLNVDRPGYQSPVQPMYKDAFNVYGGIIRFVRDGQNRVTGLEISSGRARRVPFTKTK